MARLKITNENLSTFKLLVKTLKDFLSETDIVVNKEGMRIVTLDSSNVSMCDLVLKPSFFDELSVPEEGEKFGVKVDVFSNLVSRFKSSSLVLETTDSKLELSSGENKKSLSIPLLDVETKLKEVPKLKDGVKLKFNIAELMEVLDDINQLSKDEVSVEFNHNEEGVLSLNDTGKNEFSFKKEITLLEDSEHEKEVTTALYSNSYLSKMVMPNEIVTINYKKDYPLQLSYSGDNWSLKFILAPRVETN